MTSLEYVKMLSKLDSRYEIILEAGKFFRPRQVQTRVESYRPKKQSCYYNAQLLTTFRDLLYYEGWAVTSDFRELPFEHAWNINPRTRRLIDVTWQKKGVDYFGIQIPAEYIQKHWLKTGVASDLFSIYVIENLLPKQEVMK